MGGLSLTALIGRLVNDVLGCIEPLATLGRLGADELKETRIGRIMVTLVRARPVWEICKVCAPKIWCCGWFHRKESRSDAVRLLGE